MIEFEEPVITGANIKVVGVGGAGGNALNNMVRNNLSGVSFIACNTDIQALDKNLAPHKIQIGGKLTKGLGAGGRAEMGERAADADHLDRGQALGLDRIMHGVYLPRSWSDDGQLGTLSGPAAMRWSSTA